MHCSGYCALSGNTAQHPAHESSCSGSRGLMSLLETAERGVVPGFSSWTAAFLHCSGYCALSGNTAQHPAHGPSDFGFRCLMFSQASGESVCFWAAVLYGCHFALLRILRRIREYGSTSCAWTIRTIRNFSLHFPACRSLQAFSLFQKSLYTIFKNSASSLRYNEILRNLSVCRALFANTDQSVRPFLSRRDADALKNFFEKNFWQAAAGPCTGSARAEPGGCRPQALILQRPEPAPLRTQKTPARRNISRNGQGKNSCSLRSGCAGPRLP